MRYLLGMSLQVPDQLHILRSQTMSSHRRFCPPAECFIPAGEHTRSCQVSRSLGIFEWCPGKQRQNYERIDDILCCFAILHVVVWRFFSLIEKIKMIECQWITKYSRQLTWGSKRTALSTPYSKVGRMTLSSMRTLLLVWIFR